MKPTAAVIAALFWPLAVAADGLPLRNGRFEGQVLVFKLTDDQKTRIEAYRTCHLGDLARMNEYTPYIFALSKEQASTVRKRVGYAPKWFQVYETVRGYNDGGPHWNMALRFSESEFEVPLKLLLPDSSAKKALTVIGWKPENPCFTDVRQ
jgi:hypothetical protein